jgi:APA family basic amino acid/polyamine antiporter
VERPFRTPFVYFTAPMGVISAVLLMATLPSQTWIRLVVWMAIGLLIYVFYGIHHSVLGNRYPAGKTAGPLQELVS